MTPQVYPQIRATLIVALAALFVGWEIPGAIAQEDAPPIIERLVPTDEEPPTPETDAGERLLPALPRGDAPPVTQPPAFTSPPAGAQPPADTRPPAEIRSFGRPGFYPASPRQIQVHAPFPQVNDHVGVVRPGVLVRPGDVESSGPSGYTPPRRPLVGQRRAMFDLSQAWNAGATLSPAAETVPAESNEGGWGVSGPSEPIFGRVIDEARRISQRQRGRLAGIRDWWAVEQPCDVGVGHERLIFAPFEIDVSQPLASNIRLRFDAGYDWNFPDRAEFFYGVGRIDDSGQTPRANQFDSIDYQDIRILMEFGGPNMTVGTEIPIRILDPSAIGANTAGLSDMTVTTKTVIVTGEEIQITQIFRTYLNTGAPTRGLGTGHVSLEPGLLFRYKWDDETYWHGELKYWFPIAGNPSHSGQVLRYGLGVSRLLYETDRVAMIPTLELVNWSVLDGQQSTGVGGAVEPVDGMAIMNLTSGMRFVMDRGGDLGLLELGVASSFALTSDHWYEGLLRVDCRWSF